MLKTNTLIQYFQRLNLISELQYLEMPEKQSNSKFVKYDKWNNLTTATVS